MSSLSLSPPANLQSLCESCLPILIEKLGDTNARIRESAKESILFVASLKDGGIRSYTHIILKPIKNQNAWRLVLGVLNLLQVRACFFLSVLKNLDKMNIF